mmetsp:Transcript_34660/g.88690  ORF Transcript_34660/g.88690 Transcript_34660/m.88690 type:complete len:227 (-) Transcript_34660:63-743(-)|eukprot:jgi/Tetstr1/454992/TSEL_041852.t1
MAATAATTQLLARAAPARQQRVARRTAVCRAAPGDASAAVESRRAALMGLASAAGLLAGSSPARAAIGAWDGEKGLGMCDLGDAGVDCRMKLIRGDESKKADYGEASKSSNNYTTVSGTPVSEMGDQYQQDTFALAKMIATYVELDPYDKQRPVLKKSIVNDGNTWVSRYARGGNVRKVSARAFYVGVDSLQGHFAQNGLAPYPKTKIPKLLEDMNKGCTLILEGK